MESNKALSQNALEILEVLREKFERAGKHCGTSMVDIMKFTGYNLATAQEATTELRTAKKARQRDGINLKLYFYVEERR